MRERLRREKYVRIRVDLSGCLVQEKGRRNREDRSIAYFEKYYIAPTLSLCLIVRRN